MYTKSSMFEEVNYQVYYAEPLRGAIFADCIVNPGFYQAPGSNKVMPCPSGTISPPGSTQVSECQCPAGTYKLVRESLDITCIGCPEGSSSPEGSTSIEDCVCRPGLGVASRSYNRSIVSSQDTCDAETT
jgi:hypothetical protein